MSRKSAVHTYPPSSPSTSLPQHLVIFSAGSEHIQMQAIPAKSFEPSGSFNAWHETRESSNHYSDSSSESYTMLFNDTGVRDETTPASFAPPPSSSARSLTYEGSMVLSATARSVSLSQVTGFVDNTAPSSSSVSRPYHEETSSAFTKEKRPSSDHDNEGRQQSSPANSTSSKIRVVECDSTGRVRDQNRGLLLSRRNSRAQFQELERKGKEERVYLEAFRQRLQEEKEQLAVKHAQLDAERERLRVTIEYQDEDRRKMWASLNEHMANVTAELRQQYEQQEAKLRNDMECAIANVAQAGRRNAARHTDPVPNTLPQTPKSRNKQGSPDINTEYGAAAMSSGDEVQMVLEDKDEEMLPIVSTGKGKERAVDPIGPGALTARSPLLAASPSRKQYLISAVAADLRRVDPTGRARSRTMTPSRDYTPSPMRRYTQTPLRRVTQKPQTSNRHGNPNTATGPRRKFLVERAPDDESDIEVTGPEPSPLRNKRRPQQSISRDPAAGSSTCNTTAENARAGPSTQVEPQQGSPAGGRSQVPKRWNESGALFDVSLLEEMILSTVQRTLSGYQQYNANRVGQYATPKQRARTRNQLSLQKDEDREDGFRSSYLRIARLIVRETLDIFTDNAIIAHVPVEQEDAEAYAEGLHNGPTLDDLRLDFKDKNSPWSQTVIELLTQTFQETVAAFEDLPSRNDSYVADLFKERMRHITAAWNGAMAKETAEGRMESPRETEDRVVSKIDDMRARCRQTSRLHRKFQQRRADLDVVIRHIEDQGDMDLPQWKFLEELVCGLGQHGMSSDKTDGDEHHIIRVRRKPWRRNIERQLAMIDGVKKQWPLLFFRRQGPGRQDKLRDVLENRPVSKSPTPIGLPLAMFDRDWYKARTPYAKRSLQVSETQFIWKEFDWE